MNQICTSFNPDIVYRNLEIIEMPISFVGLSTSMQLDIQVDLNKTAYLKTTHNGQVKKLEEAQEVSASHRAFQIKQIDDSVVSIIFFPTTECIGKARREGVRVNRFVIDLRVIKVEGVHCCYNELHSEIKRYYLIGLYEFCNISQDPKHLSFGDIVINTQIIKHISVKNESAKIYACVEFIPVTFFNIDPIKFKLKPGGSKIVKIRLQPASLTVCKKLYYTVKNPQESEDDTDKNCIKFSIKVSCKVLYNKKPKIVEVESLQRLYETDPTYTYVGRAKQQRDERAKVAFELYERAKFLRSKKKEIVKLCTNLEKDKCEELPPRKKGNPDDFCKILPKVITIYQLFDITITPLIINFGKVFSGTYAQTSIEIKNNTNVTILLDFQEKNNLLYTKQRLDTFKLKMQPYQTCNIILHGSENKTGLIENTLQYYIGKKYLREHKFVLQVAKPKINVSERNLKFGMATTEAFITSLPIRLNNAFNIPVSYSWKNLDNFDMPFEITPDCGTVPAHSHRICDVQYVAKPTKSKIHEVVLHSTVNDSNQNTPIELSIITKKMVIKFVEANVTLKDLPINIEKKTVVKLENPSREIATFYVVESFIPGFNITPMSGIIFPKMMLNFVILTKFSCVLEFAFDLILKINNKDNVVLPIIGNVLEPKLSISPKMIYMPRVPINLVTFISITFQNYSTIKVLIRDSNYPEPNEEFNICKPITFEIYVAQGNDKIRVREFYIEGGCSKTVYVKIYDWLQREYDIYLPFSINGLLGPPNNDKASLQVSYYTAQDEQKYEYNPKVKIMNIDKDICGCRICGVITMPYIKFSQDEFKLDYVPGTDVCLEFTMKNISKYILPLTIDISKLGPNFTLTLLTFEEEISQVSDTFIKSTMVPEDELYFMVKFHPRGQGKCINTALFYLDKNMSIAYHNLTFFGNRVSPTITPSQHLVIFPPTLVGTELTHELTIELGAVSSLSQFYHSSKDSHFTAKFLTCEVIQEKKSVFTRLNVQIKVVSNTPFFGQGAICFYNECGVSCDIDLSACFTYCPLTLHADNFFGADKNPYPYYPAKDSKEIYEYMETCVKFLEKWLYQQGFRRDLYPLIPETLNIISSMIVPQSGSKGKTFNVSILNFIKRVTGPLMKHIKKSSVSGEDEPFKYVKEIFETYRDIIALLNSRSCVLWGLRPEFLLSYDQYVTYAENVTSKNNADLRLTRDLLLNEELFHRLNKQSWFDLIIQCYKAFILSTCFFECTCINLKERNMNKILVDWYNSNISIRHKSLRGKDQPIKYIKNITTDLSDGIAVISVMMNHCPYMESHFSAYSEIIPGEEEQCIIHNASLVIEALNQLRVQFPLAVNDFFKPNYIQMLFFSIRLYITLPMLTPKDTIVFNPPLLSSSCRKVAVCPTPYEVFSFTNVILYNSKNAFHVEKDTSDDTTRKIYTVNVQYTANFIGKREAVLLMHGYNKTRIFDAYTVFILQGSAGSVVPYKKFKVTGPLYRPTKVDVLLCSPFSVNSTFDLSLTDEEVTVPVQFPTAHKQPKYFFRSLNLIEKSLELFICSTMSNDPPEQKLYFHLICLNTQPDNWYVWFRSEIGEFYIKVSTQPRWDTAIDTFKAIIPTWPPDPCSCGKACECYRSSEIIVPHKNDLMVKGLRFALAEYASDGMMALFDRLIVSETGRMILRMVLNESITKFSKIEHILRNECSYRITSKALYPRTEYITIYPHSDKMETIAVTLPCRDLPDKFSILMTSECGNDVRVYRVTFEEFQGE